MMYSYYGYGVGHHIFGLGILSSLISLIFWILVIWLIVDLVRSHRHGRCQKGECGWLNAWHKSDSAMDILRMRYAKGEISKEEFEEKRQDLK